MNASTADRLRVAALAFAEEIVAALSDESAAGAPDKLLSVDAAAEALGVGRSLVYDLIGRGDLRSVKAGRRRLVPGSAVAEYVARQGAGQ